MGNIVSRMKQENSGETVRGIDSKYETLLKDILHKKTDGSKQQAKTLQQPVKWNEIMDNYEKGQKKSESKGSVSTKKMITLEELSQNCRNEG